MRDADYAYIKDRASLLARRPDISKYDNGRCLLLAGSFGMAGAAVMAGRAALRSGCGLLTYLTDREIIPILQQSLPEAMARPADGDIDISKYDAALCGPGFLGPDSERLTEKMIAGFEGTLVLDAEALNIITRNDLFPLVRERAAKGWPTVLTPHEGEAARLLGAKSADVKADREGAAAKLRDKTDSVVVLKGPGTITAAPGHTGGVPEMIRNTTGGAGLAKGGSGDVLGGMTASFAAQGLTAFDAAVCAVYIHGLAGDAACREKGIISMMPTDTVETLPYVIKGMFE